MSDLQDYEVQSDETLQEGCLLLESAAHRMPSVILSAIYSQG